MYANVTLPHLRTQSRFQSDCSTQRQDSPADSIQASEAAQELLHPLLPTRILDTFFSLLANLRQRHIGRLHDEDGEGRNADGPGSGQDVLVA